MGDVPDWSEILIHHSGTRPETTWDSIRQYHVRERGYRDVAYHFGAVKSGDTSWEIQPGRPLSMEGSHCPGHNRTAIGICLVGNFNIGPPPELQLSVAAALVADLMHDWRIPIQKVYMHRQFRQTECPGSYFNLEHFRNMVMGLDF